VPTIIAALTYDGSIVDTVLNAVVLIVVLAALVAQRRSPWWITLAVMTVLQVALWFAMGVVGFSLVWSGLTGAILVELIAQRRSPSRRWVLVVSAAVAGAAIIYYAVTFPPVTTIAHLLAVLVGAGIHALARKRLAAKQRA
jgi:hypothetical protein